MRSVVGEYLEAIFSLQAEGRDAHAVTLAGLFGVSRAAASATVGRLARDGLIEYAHRDVTLTETGMARAEAGLRRHCITERFLTDVLGMSWVVAHDQARQFERGLTPVVAERMDARLAWPAMCPHGNPVPRPGLSAVTYYRDSQAFVLATASPGMPLRMLAVSELAEHQSAWLQCCDAAGLWPGTVLQVRARAGKQIDLEVRDRPGAVSLETELASHIWVVAAGEEQ